MQSTTLICPKCRGEMRNDERNGILVDRCRGHRRRRRRSLLEGLLGD